MPPSEGGADAGGWALPLDAVGAILALADLPTLLACSLVSRGVGERASAQVSKLRAPPGSAPPRQLWARFPRATSIALPDWHDGTALEHGVRLLGELPPGVCDVSVGRLGCSRSQRCWEAALRRLAAALHGAQGLRRLTLSWPLGATEATEPCLGQLSRLRSLRLHVESPEEQEAWRPALPPSLTGLSVTCHKLVWDEEGDDSEEEDGSEQQEGEGIEEEQEEEAEQEDELLAPGVISLAALAACSGLQQLSVAGTAVALADLRLALSGLQQLSSLQLGARCSGAENDSPDAPWWRKPLLSDSWAELSALQRLQRLEAPSAQLAGAPAWQLLAQQLPELQELSLRRMQADSCSTAADSVTRLELGLEPQLRLVGAPASRAGRRGSSPGALVQLLPRLQELRCGGCACLYQLAQALRGHAALRELQVRERGCLLLACCWLPRHAGRQARSQRAPTRLVTNIVSAAGCCR
jgi:hypothetical protein